MTNAFQHKLHNALTSLLLGIRRPFDAAVEQDLPRVIDEVPEIQAKLLFHNDPDNCGGMAPEGEGILGTGRDHSDVEERRDRIQPVSQ